MCDLEFGSGMAKNVTIKNHPGISGETKILIVGQLSDFLILVTFTEVIKDNVPVLRKYTLNCLKGHDVYIVLSNSTEKLICVYTHTHKERKKVIKKKSKM